MIIYIGNKLSEHSYTPTSVETLGPLLGEIYDIKTFSNKKNKFLRFIDFSYQIYKNREHTELILIDTYSSLNFYYAVAVAFLARIFSIPYIPILHGGNLANRLKKSVLLSSFLFKHSSINISPSKYLQEHFSSLDFKTIYIPNNIDISVYPFKERTTVTPKILYVRAFHKIYNPTMAVKVLSKIIKEYPNAELCMVGPDKDGSLEDVKNLAIKLNVIDSITFTGQLTKEEWIKLSSKYNIFINTTNFDNQPVSIIEAMALGFPIVSTDAGGMPYLIENMKDGIIVPKNDSTKMANAIISILNNNMLAQELSNKARNSAEEYDWVNVEKKWVSIINDTLKKG